jgi:hypothetical protein
MKYRNNSNIIIIFKKFISYIEGRYHEKNINLKNYLKKNPTKNDKQKDPR